MTSIKPRAFQSKGINEAREKIRNGVKRLVMAAPTGAGKGFIMAVLTQLGLGNGNTVLTILYGQDLIIQTDKNYRRYYGIKSRLIMGGLKSDDSKSIIASISTLSRRNLPDAGFLIIDECHQSNSNQYEKIFEHYKDKIIIGLSATPINNLTNFEDYVILATVKELIAQGFLVQPIHYRPRVLIDTSKVSVEKGEFNDHELETEALKVTGDIVQEYITRAKGRPAVMFCVNISHSLELCAAFNAAGVKAHHIDSNTPLEERTDVLNKLRAGEIEVITNVNIFSTGIDCPEISCVGLARPTHSEILYVQQGGRGLRTADGKNDCIILDYADNVSRFGLLTDDRPPVLTPKEKKKKKDTGEKELKIWQCLFCYGVNEIKEPVCMCCGKEKPVKVVDVKSEDGELELVQESPAKKRSKNKSVADVMPFGKYKGKHFSELPMHALTWAINYLNSSDDPILQSKLKEELKRRMA